MPIEEALLKCTVEELPATLRSIVESQINTYNLVQREIDGRAISVVGIARG